MVKKFLTFIISILIFTSAIQAENTPQTLLAQADQLFAKKKFTESYLIYSKLFKSNGKYTPQTLLKMAFVKESLGEYTEALFYLNLFYELYPDKKIFNQMKEIAEKNKLEGFHYSDFEFFSNLYRNYHEQIILGILGLVFVYFLAVITNKIFIKGISNSSPIFFVFVLAGIFFLINFGEKYINPVRAIVLKNNCLLMSEPAAGSKLLAMIEKGNRVVITGEQDIWYSIRINNKTGYIRKSNFANSI
jgi:tetratricopeptide (TPR) repeat protein